MKEYLLRLHEDMERAIGQIAGEASGAEMAEQGYQLGTNYWQQVKSHLRQNKFSTEADEIEFFKNIKPRFTAPLEYFLLVTRYHIYAGAGLALTEELQKDETARILKFRQTHAPFISYYEDGRSDWDDLYFLRKNYHKVKRPPSQVYDRAPDFRTNGDWILTIVFADRLFEVFLQNNAPSSQTPQ